MSSNKMNARQRWLLLAGCIVFGLLIPSVFLLPESDSSAESRAAQASASADEAETSASSDKAPHSQVLDPSTEQPLANTPDYGAMLFKTVLSLGFVCLLAFVALKWGLGRLYGSQQADDTISVLSRMRLGPKREVLVARIGPRHLILGSTEQQLSVLGELSADEAADYFEEHAAGEETDG